MVGGGPTCPIGNTERMARSYTAVAMQVGRLQWQLPRQPKLGSESVQLCDATTSNVKTRPLRPVL